MVLIDSKRPFYLISVFTVAILFSVIIYQEYQKINEKNFATIFTAAGTVKINVEYAKTSQKLNEGLMNRSSLAKNSGMFFIFPDEKYRNFWMKNTLIPLDIIFISSGGQINEIATLKPCQKDAEYCPTYNSKNPAQYVIEVNAGFSQNNKIAEGDILEIPKF